LKNIFKTIVDTTASLSFTFASFIIVAATLSGQTRQIALWANGVAIFVTYFYQVVSNLKNEQT
jgi:hypothetical protein